MDDFDHAFQLATAHHKALDLSQAVEAYRRAISLRPGVAAVHNNMGSALRLLGRVDEAIVAYLAALKLSPDAVQIWSNLGNAYKEVERIDEAIVAYRQAIAVDTNNAPAHNNLAAALEDSGDMSAAVESYRRASEIDPNSPAIGSNLVYAMHFSSAFDADDLLIAHRAWNDRYAKHLLPLPNPLPRGEGTRLRIGYLSPDFRSHPVGHFMAPILANHDRQAFEVFCYADVLRPDAVTARLRSHAEQWRQILGMSDEQVADRIRADGIDVLVDLTMHMARNRMGMFARKPAAVQVTYLAYCSTTGLDAIDYRLTDPHLDAVLPRPKGETAGDKGKTQTDETDSHADLRSSSSDENARKIGNNSTPNVAPHTPPLSPPGRGIALPYVERSLYLPQSYWCYGPPEQAPAVEPTPAIAAGYVTFGCFNNFCKVSPEALATWAEILRRVPQARLALHAKPGSHRARVRETFRKSGVDPDRIEFASSRPFAEYMAAYSHIDLALDPFPYGGGTTTFDGLWMGVPLVTLRGRTAVGRGGVSILSNLGLTDLIADSPAEYVAIAIREASDLARLNERRQTMRPMLQSSILTDAPRWTRELEAIYQQIAPQRST
ncbi:tetratricopeptide repeat protein [soil metagenome]